MHFWLLKQQYRRIKIEHLRNKSFIPTSAPPIIPISKQFSFGNILSPEKSRGVPLQVETGRDGAGTRDASGIELIAARLWLRVLHPLRTRHGAGPSLLVANRRQTSGRLPRTRQHRARQRRNRQPEPDLNCGICDPPSLRLVILTFTSNTMSKSQIPGS